MPSPTLITSYAVHSAGADTSNLTTPSFTPSNGEVIVVKIATWDANNAAGATSGGGQTYTTRVTGPTSGFNPYVRIDTAVISGSPGSMAVTVAGTATNSRHSIVVERWTGTLDATPAVNGTTTGSGAPSANITTEAAGSAVSWVSADALSGDPATRTYRLSATEDGLWDGHLGSNGVFYFAYANNVGAVGTYAMGMTAPGGQTWALAGVEIQGASGISQAISPASESDSAIALGRVRSRTLGIAAVVETVMPLGRRKTRLVGVTVETSAAVTLGGADAPIPGALSSSTSTASLSAASSTSSLNSSTGP